MWLINAANEETKRRSRLFQSGAYRSEAGGKGPQGSCQGCARANRRSSAPRSTANRPIGGSARPRSADGDLGRRDQIFGCRFLRNPYSVLPRSPAEVGHEANISVKATRAAQSGRQPAPPGAKPIAILRPGLLDQAGGSEGRRQHGRKRHGFSGTQRPAKPLPGRKRPDSAEGAKAADAPREPSAG